MQKAMGEAARDISEAGQGGHGHDAGRRRLLAAAGALALLPLAGCLAMRAVGEPVRASRQGAAHVGRIRSAHGLGALRVDGRLESVAVEQVRNMARSGRMAHTAAFGRGFSRRLRSAGLEGAAAENIAHGRFDMDRVFDVWMGSAGHRRNLLDPRFTRYGLAWLASPDDPARRWWSIVLADD